MQARTVLLLSLLALGFAPASWAQLAGQTVPGTEDVGLDDRIGERIPTHLAFTDQNGQTVQLADFYEQGKPVLIQLVYFNCPMLCNLLLDGWTRAAAQVTPTPGEDYTMLTISFDPTETPDQALRQQAKEVQNLGRPEAAEGWHFLTGSEGNIKALADAVGFRYQWNEDAQQYAHPAAVAFTSPEGTITRYLVGVGFEPTDIRAALAESRLGTPGTFVEQFIMFCFQYDPSTHTYTADVQNLMKLAGGLTVLALILAVATLARRYRSAPPVSLPDPA
jgi:protein SCO1/2